MAKNRNLKGINVQINGDTVGLQESLKDVNSKISRIQASLKDVKNLLKLDPSNIELWAQKQTYLSIQIENTKTKLDALKAVQEQAKAAVEAGTLDADKYEALCREVADILDTASAEANTNVTMLGESFKYCAPVALGYSVQDVTTALGLMANAGIKGAAAGTASLMGMIQKAVRQAMERFLSAMGQTLSALLEGLVAATKGALSAVGEVAQPICQEHR